MFTNLIKEIENDKMSWPELIDLLKTYRFFLLTLPAILALISIYLIFIIPPRLEAIATLKVGAINRSPEETIIERNRKYLESIGTVAEKVKAPLFFTELKKRIFLPGDFALKNDTFTTELAPPEHIHIKVKLASKELATSIALESARMVIEQHQKIFIEKTKKMPSAPHQKSYPTVLTDEIKVSEVFPLKKKYLLVFSIFMLGGLVTLIVAHIHHRLVK